MDVAVLGVMIPIIAIVTGGAIAVTSMLIKHQRSMAELIHRDHSDGEDRQALVSEVYRLRTEVDELRSTLRALEGRPENVGSERSELESRNG